MAVTHGHGNPDWTIYEIILALDLFFARAGVLPGPSDPAVVALSDELQRLPIHSGATRRPSFRNPAGVAFKLQNLKSVSTSKQIRLQIKEDSPAESDIASIGDDEVFLEGRVLTASHRRRERQPKLRRSLLKDRGKNGALTCDVCGEGPKLTDPEFHSAGFEAHHIVPLASGDTREVRIKDLALLCATCHRLIHRAIHVKKAWVSVPELRILVAG